ncbi:hypothetical protein CRG98_007786 [Punica granatum]|uniref:Uncharacterized protein n=1 Tax=Punica granatum TaxID=22663 RepID=A0A2I0KTN8_PUNGR|nr:hypothetical protein CRG98_007786 [Punica granatum]
MARRAVTRGRSSRPPIPHYNQACYHVTKHARSPTQLSASFRVMRARLHLAYARVLNAPCACRSACSHNTYRASSIPCALALKLRTRNTSVAGEEQCTSSHLLENSSWTLSLYFDEGGVRQ